MVRCSVNGQMAVSYSGMTTYTITPRGRGYWIEAVAEDGSRQSIERFDTEDAAVRRLRALEIKAGIINRWNTPTPRVRR